MDDLGMMDVTVRGIFDCMIDCLHSYGMADSFLSNNFISLTCDGAAVMIGNKKGVGALFREICPSLVIWHCANHRLELSVSDTVKSVSGINSFNCFIGKLYVLYHASPQNSRELQVCASLLETELLKIGRILTARWVASSFRSVTAGCHAFTH